MSSKIFGIEFDTISKLADMVKEKDLGEITLACGDDMITIKGKKFPPMPPVGMPMPPAEAVPTAAEVPAKPAAKAVPSGNVVKAPIVGTFYAASAPDKPPFVTVGQQVKKGDVLMIIESMKLMNEIQSDFDGTVAEIFVQNGDAVEYDQPIMIIR